METDEKSGKKRSKAEDEVLNWVAWEYWKALKAILEKADEKHFRARQSLENEIERYGRDIDFFRQKVSFVEGVFLGLFFGVFGNILVSHYYGMIESWSSSTYGFLFEINRLVFIISLMLILVVSFHYYRKFGEWKKEEEKWTEGTKEILDKYTAKLHEITEEDSKQAREERIRVLKEAEKRFGKKSKRGRRKS